jgi:hypothetical protein
LAGKSRCESKTLVKFQLIVTLDKVIHINTNILIVVTQPQFTTKNRFTFSPPKIIIKIGHLGHLGLDVFGSNPLFVEVGELQRQPSVDIDGDRLAHAAICRLTFLR